MVFLVHVVDHSEERGSRNEVQDAGKRACT